MKSSSGRFIVVDGIAGSGKSTLIKGLKEELQKTDLVLFDLKEWCEKHRSLPSFTDIEKADLLFTYEPTGSWVGEAIRKEMSRTDFPYDPKILAEAFSLDRLLLYRRVIIPALDAKIPIIQDRSVTSSIIYQPAMKDGPNLETVLALPGNELALQHPPTHVILTAIDPSLAVNRASKRKELSKGVFEDVELLRAIDQRFRSRWFRELLEEKGTKLLETRTDESMEKSKEDFLTLIHEILPVWQKHS